MLFASPVTNKMDAFDNAPLIALLGSTSLGKTQTSMLLQNHFSDKVNWCLDKDLIHLLQNIFLHSVKFRCTWKMAPQSLKAWKPRSRPPL